MEQEVRGMLGATPPEQLQTGDEVCQDWEDTRIAAEPARLSPLVNINLPARN